VNFHLPKPLHGWRAFIGEVGIIVLGVLIALGFGQIVQEWQWHNDVRTTRQALANELANAANQAAERNGRWTGDPLVLGSGVRPAPHWDNLAIRRVYGSPLRGWSQDVWDAAKSGGVLDHMSHAEVASYSDVYGEVTAIRDFQGEELMLESNLSFLSTDQQLDNRSRIEALGKLGQLDALNGVLTGLSSLLLEGIKMLHLHVDKTASSEPLDQMLAVQRQYRGACVKDVEIQY
jgi:hypothetical protein